LTIIVDICIIYNKMWWNKLNFFYMFFEKETEEEENCPYKEYIDEQEETLKKYENKKEEKV
tara:strand:- start:3883 stop:4065 length:183 start_codon:yes stop_codon:yes gene_type:complete